ncbi:MAG: carboxymuconolactone decarboxylase family protein [Dehalococcoidia bacterium]
MARLPYLDAADLREEDRDLLARPINLNRALAHSIPSSRNFWEMGNWIRFGATVDRRLREMAILQVGYVTRSAYEWSHHLQLAMTDFGVSPDDVRAIIAESEGRESGLPALDRAVLRLAREMTADLAGSREAFDVIRDGLGHEQLTELVVIIGFYNLVVRYLLTMEVDVEAAYLPYLEQFPLPVSGG